MEMNKRRLALTVLLVMSCWWLVPEAEAHDPQYECEKKDFLDTHNRLRLENNLPPFCWNETVEKYAVDYATARICDCKMEHSDVSYCPDMPYGENLAWSSGDYAICEAVQAWYDEVKDYDYNSNSCCPGKMCGHYTQIVWKNSTQLGCKKVKCTSGGGSLITCNYWPPGNIVGQKPF